MNAKVLGSEAIRLGIAEMMNSDPKVLTYGLGVNDPGRIFGTTEGLVEEFGPKRVFETPTSELALTGVGVGLALGGYKVIHSHQRMDFSLLAMDQLVNSAAKWRFMFGDQFKIPYLVRMIIGRGWGQGPTHSQNFESWLAHVPGLRVIVPASAQDMFDCITSLRDTAEPIVVIEHRWLHGVSGELSTDVANDLSNLASIKHSHTVQPRLRIVTWGLETYDSLAAQSEFSRLDIPVEVLQIRELNDSSLEEAASLPESIEAVIVVAGSWGIASYADSVIARIAQGNGIHLKVGRVSHPDAPEPTALHQLTAYHVSRWRILKAGFQLLGIKENVISEAPQDQPGGNRFGPF